MYQSKYEDIVIVIDTGSVSEIPKYPSDISLRSVHFVHGHIDIYLYLNINI